VESRNARFLENDLISGSDQTQNFNFENDHIDSHTPTSSDRLVVHAPQVQTGNDELIIEEPQTVDQTRVDPIVEKLPEPLMQLVENHTPQENDDSTLRRSTRIRRSAIPSDYEVFLQESDCNNVGAENDPETFSQAMNCRESALWLNAMKEEMNSMASNGVWDLVELPNGSKVIGCKCVFKTKRDSLGNIERYMAKLVAKGFTQKEGID